MRHPSVGREKARRLYPMLGPCEVCGARPAAERHHKSGDTDDNQRENILLVCRTCHRVVDGRLERLSARRHEVSQQRTHCRHGHPLTPDNVLLIRDGQRRCRTCANTATARWKARKRNERTRLLPP